MNELANQKNALAVSYEVAGTTVKLDPEIVKTHLVRGKGSITDQEVLFFVNLCKAQKLNPLSGNEVYLIKYDDKMPAQIVVGKSAYMRRMFEHPDYLCKEDGIVVKRKTGEIEKREGCCLYPGDELIGGWCRVHYVRKSLERTAYKEVSLSEYSSGKSTWNDRPATMINKVAISQCAREAFPKEFDGLYSEEEMVASGAIPVDSNNTEINYNEKAEDPITTQEERQQLFALAQQVKGEGWKKYISSIIMEKGLSSTAYMTKSICKSIMEELRSMNSDAE